MKRTALGIALVAGIITLDQWTKSLVHARFRLGESISIVTDYFNLTYIRNTGAAFGLLAQADASFRVPFFIVVPVIALGMIAWMFRQVPKEDWKLALSLVLVVSGALGNLIDRVARGYVIDFLDFHWRYQYHFPAFNVADIAICFGVGGLMLDLWLRNPDRQRLSSH